MDWLRLFPEQRDVWNSLCRDLRDWWKQSWRRRYPGRERCDGCRCPVTHMIDRVTHTAAPLICGESCQSFSTTILYACNCGRATAKTYPGHGPNVLAPSAIHYEYDRSINGMSAVCLGEPENPNHLIKLQAD